MARTTKYPNATTRVATATSLRCSSIFVYIIHTNDPKITHLARNTFGMNGHPLEKQNIYHYFQVLIHLLLYFYISDYLDKYVNQNCTPQSTPFNERPAYSKSNQAFYG